MAKITKMQAGKLLDDYINKAVYGETPINPRQRAMLNAFKKNGWKGDFYSINDAIGQKYELLNDEVPITFPENYHGPFPLATKERTFDISPGSTTYSYVGSANYYDQNPADIPIEKLFKKEIWPDKVTARDKPRYYDEVGFDWEDLVNRGLIYPAEGSENTGRYNVSFMGKLNTGARKNLTKYDGLGAHRKSDPFTAAERTELRRRAANERYKADSLADLSRSGVSKHYMKDKYDGIVSRSFDPGNENWTTGPDGLPLHDPYSNYSEMYSPLEIRDAMNERREDIGNFVNEGMFGVYDDDGVFHSFTLPKKDPLGKAGHYSKLYWLPREAQNVLLKETGKDGKSSFYTVPIQGPMPREYLADFNPRELELYNKNLEKVARNEFPYETPSPLVNPPVSATAQRQAPVPTSTPKPAPAPAPASAPAKDPAKFIRNMSIRGEGWNRFLNMQDDFKREFGRKPTPEENRMMMQMIDGDPRWGF